MVDDNSRGWDKPINLKYNLKTFWRFISQSKLLVYGTIILSFIGEAITFFDNFVFKYLVDKATLFSQDKITAAVFAQIILYSVLVYLAVRFLGAVVWFIRIKLINRLDARTMSAVEQEAFWHITNLSYKFHADKKTGSIISKFTRGVNKVESFIGAFVFHVFPVFFRLLLSVGVIFYFDIITALILIAMTVVFITVGVIVTNMQKHPQGIANYKEDILKQNLSDVFMNIDTVKYFAKEKPTFRFFRKLSKSLKEARLTFWHYYSWHAGIQTFVIGVGVAAIFYTTFTGFLEGRITLGSITLIYAAVWRLIPLLFGLIHGYREFIRSTVDVDALFAMFKERNEVEDRPRAPSLKVKAGKIDFNHVSFAYPASEKKNEKTVLKDFHLDIQPNTKVALVGPSGSGKTTVVKVLYRLFDINEGTITVDGQDISKVKQHSLRESMSIVPQEPLLFDNTIYYNVAYANPTASRRDVWKAIRFAQLDKFIEELPFKENTIVGERGVKLSGGEKQRVSIARAILANKKILVLDEATSALDSETEKEIQRDLDKLMQGRTSIIIAHRLSTIMKADTIVVMGKGQILEIGTHEELKNKRGGLYKKLWELQQGGRL